jgi:hypothetical protein
MLRHVNSSRNQNENISAYLPCRINAECFRRTYFAVPIETAGREPQVPDKNNNLEILTSLIITTVAVA